MITEQSTNYFKFHINRDVDKVTVVLNSITGDADLFLSRKNLYPSITNKCKLLINTH